jgi:uncharacterized repeat protein (TIGR01451 family)
MRLTTLMRLVGGAAVLIAVCVPATPVAAYTGVGPTIDCNSSKVFLAQGSPTQLKAVTYGLGSATFVNVGAAAGDYNGIGYNNADGYVYAVGDTVSPAGATNRIVQVDAGGAVYDTGMTVPFNSFIGTVDAGIYYTVDPNAVPAALLYKANLTTNTVTSIPLSAAPGFSDTTFVGGFLWGHVVGATQFSRVDPATGTVAFFNEPATVVPATVGDGANWTYANGNLGLNDNNNGDIYQVHINNPTSAAPTFTLVSKATGPTPTGQNDGTACVGLDVDLGILKSTPPITAPGGAISWTLTVHNFGPGTSSGDTVTDIVPAAVTNVTTPTAGCTVAGNKVTCIEGVLALGGESTITINGTAPAAPATPIDNSATVVGNDHDPQPINDTASSSTATTGSSDLAMTKTASTTPAVPGDQLTYTLSVKNNGPTFASNVSVTDPLPAGLTFVSASPGCTFAAGTVTCLRPTLVNGATANFDVVVLVASSLRTPIANTATVTSPDTDPTPGNNTSTATVPVDPSADLSIAKSALPNPAFAGQNVTYTLAVTNIGPSDATNVSASDAFPAGLTFVSASPGCANAAGVVTCTQATLASGTTANFTIVAAVAASASGSLTNVASVTSAEPDPDPSNNAASMTTPVIGIPSPRAADLEVVKIADHGSVATGQPITWTIAITNRGPDAATGAVLIDQPSLPVTFTRASSTQGTCTKVAPVRCTLGSIAPGATVTVTLTGSASTTGTLHNVARVSSDVADPQPANSTASATTDVLGAALQLTKKADKTSVHAGGRIGYTIRVTNPGSSATKQTRVCDHLPSGLVYVSSSPKAKRSDGSYCWDIGTLAPKGSERLRITTSTLRGARGKRRNTATASAKGARTRTAVSPAVNVLAAGAHGGGVTG